MVSKNFQKILFLALILLAVGFSFAEQLNVRGIGGAEIFVSTSKEILAKPKSLGSTACLEGITLGAIRNWSDSSLKQEILSLEEWIEIGDAKWLLTESDRNSLPLQTVTSFSSEKCLQSLKYFLKARVFVENNSLLNSFPEARGNKDSLASFTQCTFLVECDDLEIREKALQFAGKSTKETVKNVFEYLAKNVSYDELLVEDEISAKETFLSKRGSCDEFSHLAIAFLRANNIPSRIVVGYANYGGGWREHAWIEYYDSNSGWVSADPTFNEMNADALHVTFAKAVDKSAVIDRIMHSGDSVIETINSSGFSVNAKTGFPPKDPFERLLSLSGGKDDGEAVIVLAVRNVSDSEVGANFIADIPEKKVSAGQRLGLIPSHSEKQFEWRLGMGLEEVERLLPICVSDEFGEACTRGRQSEEQGIIVNNVTAGKIGSGISVNVTVSNNSSTEKDFYIRTGFSENFLSGSRFSLSPSAKENFEFILPSNAGQESILVEVSSIEQRYYEKIEIAKGDIASKEQAQAILSRGNAFLESLNSFVSQFINFFGRAFS